MDKLNQRILTSHIRGGMPVWFAGFVVLYVVGVVICIWPFLWNLPYGDDGTHTYDAYMAGQGKVPYRDFFDFIWPLTFWLGGFLFRVSGFSLVFLHSVITVFFLFLIGGTVALFKPFLPWRWLALLMLLLWMPILPDMLFQWNHHLISMTTAMVTLLYLYRPLLNAHRLNQTGFAYSTKQLLIGGVLAGTVMIGTQSLGLILGCALATFLVMNAYACFKPQGWLAVLKPVGLYWIGFAVPLVITFSILMTLGAWDNFIYDTITWVFSGGYQETTTQWYLEEVFVRMVSFIARFWMGLTQDLKLIDGKLVSVLIRMPLIAWSPVLGILWGFHVHRDVFIKSGSVQERLQRCHWPILFLLCSGTALFIASLSNITAHLIAFHWWVTLGLAFVAMHSLLTHWAPLFAQPQHQPRLRRLSFGVLAFWIGAMSYSGFWPLIQDTQVFMKQDRVASYGLREEGLLLNYLPLSAKGMDAIATYIHDNSTEVDTVYAFAHSPVFYMLTDRANPTRFQWALKFLNSERQLKESYQDILVAKPKFVIYDYRDKHFFTHDLRAKNLRDVDYRLHEIMGYVEAHYTLAIKVDGQFMVFERQN